MSRKSDNSGSRLSIPLTGTESLIYPIKNLFAAMVLFCALLICASGSFSTMTTPNEKIVGGVVGSGGGHSTSEVEGLILYSVAGQAVESGSLEVSGHYLMGVGNIYTLQATGLADTTPPIVTVESPAIAVSEGTQYAISWEASDNVALSPEAFTLWYTINEGSDWSPVTTEVLGSQETTYIWQVPNVATNKAMISVEAMDWNNNIGYGISGTFEIAGLVSHWKLDETSGTNALDSVDSNNGTTHGVTWTTDGKIGGAGDFNRGNGDYIDIGNNTNLDNSEFTISAWINMDNTYRHNVIVVKGDTSQFGYGYYFLVPEGTNLLYFKVGEAHVGATHGMNVGEWYHVAATYNSTTMAIYINGAFENSAESAAVAYTSPGQNGRIGKSNTPWYDSGAGFDGKIDEVRIYNKALSSEEVKALYDEENPPVYNVSVTPASAELFASASTTTAETTYYHLVVSNEGNATDSFTLSAANAPLSSWTAAFYPEDDDKGVPSGVMITSINGLAAGATREVFVGITPPMTNIWSVNTTKVTITSINDPSKTDISTLETATGVWTMFHHDPQHTGRSPFKGPEQGAFKWSYTTGGAILYSSPVIGSDGTVYVGANDYNLYAIDSGGSFKWSYTTGGTIESSPAIGQDGTVYVVSYDGNLYAINSGGSFKWSYPTASGYVRGSPAIGPDGAVYVVKYLGGPILAINPDGSLKWTGPYIDTIFSSPAIGSDGTVYYGVIDEGSGHFGLCATNPDGTLKWMPDIGASSYSSPAIGSDGTIYIGDDAGNLCAFNPDSSLKWSYATGGAIISSPAIGPDSTVYVGSIDNKLYAIDSGGSFKWSYTTGDRIYSSPAIGSDGTVYVGSIDNKLYAINSAGILTWSCSTEGRIFSSPTIGPDGTVYVGSEDHNLYAFTEAATSLTLKVYLQGFYQGAGSQQPTTIEVEIRSGASPDIATTIVATKEVSLDATGTGTVEINDAGNYYVAVKHKVGGNTGPNHLAIITNDKVTFEGGTNIVNISVPSGGNYFPAYTPSGQPEAMWLESDGNKSLRGGDADGSNSISITDYLLWRENNGTFSPGWGSDGPKVDFDGSDSVTISDYLIWQKNNGCYSYVP